MRWENHAVVFDLDGVLVDSEQLWDAVRRGVATEANRPWPTEATRAMQGMSTAEWSAYLTDTVGIPAEPDGEVGAGKPSPAVYQTVVGRLGVDPVQAIAIEDSSNGLRSAATAGLSVLAVPHAAFPPSKDALALADVIVNSLEEITLELVASMGRQG